MRITSIPTCGMVASRLGEGASCAGTSDALTIVNCGQFLAFESLSK